MTAPSVQDQTFLSLSTTDWDAPQFGSRQQIALRLARRGHSVLFVEIPRALHSLVSDPTGTRRALRRLGHIRQVPDGPLVYTPPLILPLYYNPVTNAVNQRLLLRYLHRTLARLGWQPDVFWTYWPNTDYLISKLGEKVSVYHCIDEFAASSYPLTSPKYITALEKRLCEKVNVILTRSKKLWQGKKAWNENTFLLRGGVDYELFSKHYESSLAPPPELASIGPPRAGMVGTLDDRIDMELLCYLAECFSQVSFVLVGPVKRHRLDIGPLRELPNFHFISAKPHSEVPLYIKYFDACLIPYKVNDFTASVSPLKLYEYLAMGKRVVSTALPYVYLEKEHIAIAETKELFAAALEESLKTDLSEAERETLREVASRNSWDRQVEQISAILAPFLERAL